MDDFAQLSKALAGRYDVEREIGRGGMATVYLARDVRHKRYVALKLLNPELGAVLGAERFLAEIQVTANLQHPNLLPLFDSGEAGGFLFYVMPFVEGESLRARLEREKQLPISEAVRIAVCVAKALDYAHRHGVIHRDLKPENILIHEDNPVVADFGIALAVSNAGGNRITQSGLSLGTPQYMSPEQATGDRSIDGRTDVYSLGTVLYEMLTGDPPHMGSTAQAIIARVITDKPRSVRASRDTVPEHVDWAVERALAKLPADRWATANDMSAALEGKADRHFAIDQRHVAGDGHHSTTTQTRRQRAGPTAALLAIAVVVAFAAGSVGSWFLVHRETVATPRVSRFVIALPDSAKFRVDIAGVQLAMSPDGSKFAYIGGTGSSRGLYLRNLDDLDARRVPGTELAQNPQFSPDGGWIAFTVENQLKRVPLGGGPATAIVDSVNRFSWGDGDIVVYASSRGGGLRRVRAIGGESEWLVRPDTANDHISTWPFVLPGGKAVLFNILSGSIESAELAVVRLADGRVTRLGVLGSNPRYVESGHVLLGRLDGTLAAVPFDLQTLQVTGPAITVLERLSVKRGGATEIGVSRSGTLLYVRAQLDRRVVAVDRSGRVRVVRSDPQGYGEPRISPDGKHLAFRIGSGGGTDIWIHDVASGTLSRLTHDAKGDGLEWSGDSRRLAWHVSDGAPRGEVRWQPWDGSTAAETLIRDGAGVGFAPGANFFLSAMTGGEIHLVTLDSSRTATTLFRAPSLTSLRISPDGHWVAYALNSTGRPEVYVRSITQPSGLHQISTDGGREVVWSPSGRELFYRAAGRLLSATVATSPEFRVVRRDTLFEDVFIAGIANTFYDVTRDGKEFIFTQGVGEHDPVLVNNWLNELRERMSTVTAKK